MDSDVDSMYCDAPSPASAALMMVSEDADMESVSGSRQSRDPSQATQPMDFVRNSIGDVSAVSVHCNNEVAPLPPPSWPSPFAGGNTALRSEVPTSLDLSSQSTTVDLRTITRDLQTSASSTTTATSAPRKRGRPKGSGKVPKLITHGPRPRLGRPPGTGYKQKLKVLGEDGPALAAKKPRGRPRKQETPAVSIEFRKKLASASNTPNAPTPPNPSHAWAAIFDGTKSMSTTTPSMVPPPPVGCSSARHAASPPPGHSTPTAAATSSQYTIIADEDPQRHVEDLDDDEGSEGVGDGLGEEDDEPDDDDEADDEAGPSKDRTPEPGSSTHRQPRLLPAWLLEPFKARLEESKRRDANGLPPLYAKHGTFWFPQKSSFFILRQNHFSPPDLYNPRFFLWDPETLCGRIPCPNCTRPLHRHGEISRPRRCVDVNSTFWIIGYRYRCNSCIHPKSKKKTVTFRSWDPRILEVLPPALAAEFPAKMSHRSAISNTLFEWMRSCFQNGMGSQQFSDAVRVQHLLAHDKLHLQYLQHLALRISSLDHWTGERYEAFLPFDDVSSRGRHGFTPSSRWCHDMYDNYIEMHSRDFHQHTAMLTCEVCALDHSHKITKHIARVDGEQVFTALLTTTNERGEIRTCNLTATKSHSQSEIALNRMETSLTLYGHLHPLVCYTDTIADRQFLERCIPSLRSDIVPIEKYGDLEAFVIPLPPEVNILTKNTTSSINDAMRLILDDVPQDEGCLVVGFDSEWNVEVSPYGNMQPRHSKTAIIQIAYQNLVYILQISEMLEKGELPHMLKLLLSHPRILKAGRLIDSDLAYLQEACHSLLAFSGGLDLAKYAKDRRVIGNISKTSLSDLCALVLHKRLDKNTSERVSQDWENRVLTEEQLQYAAKDAYVSLRLYEELVKIDVPCPLPESLHPFMPVVLYSTDNTTVIAEGHISPNLEAHIYDGINITPTRTLIVVSKVYIPGAIVTTHQQRPLNSFGPPPFSIVCLCSHLRIFNPMTSFQIPAIQPSPINHLPMVLDAAVEVDSNQLMDSDESTEESEGILSLGNLLSQDLADSGSLEKISRDIDSASATLGLETLGPDPLLWDYDIHSRVLKDVWHVFHMFYISATHGLRKQFTRELRDAIFIPDSVDKARINAWGATQVPPRTYESLRNSSQEWLRKRCKHIIPPPHILYPLVANVFRTYGPLIDPKSKKPLFSPDNWKTAKNVLDLVKNGYLSDPPGVSLYTIIGIDKKAAGLPMYRCARGTNSTEGGVHTHIRSRLPKFGASIRHVQASLMDFVLRHNLLTGTYNSTGQHYRGHFSIWITNHIQELLISLQDILINPVHISGWVNGNLYITTNERLGILPIPEDIRSSTAMATYVPALDQNQKYHFLAEIQGTRKPVLPIHTSAEKQLFRQLMNSHPAFSPKSGEPHWHDAVQIWNSNAERMNDVSYKLIEQLKAFYEKSKTLSNIRNALSLSAEARRPLSLLIHDPLRSARAPVLPLRQLQLHSVEKGLLDLPVASATPNTTLLQNSEPSHNIDVQFEQSPFTTQVGSLPGPSSSSAHAINSSSQTLFPSATQTCEILARQRVANSIAKTKPTKDKRKRRTCRKCSKIECPGSQKVANCQNPCQDCTKVTCQGRNPKYLTKRCWEGWN